MWENGWIVNFVETESKTKMTNLILRKREKSLDNKPYFKEK